MPDVLQYLGKETAVDAANAIVHFLQANTNNSFRSQVIDADSVSAKTIVAAPGMPCGVTPQATAKLGQRLLHDPLQIGVACMLADATTR